MWRGGLGTEHQVHIQFEELTILFGLFEGYNKANRKLINSYILIGKMCISKFKYGSYNNINMLFDYEVTLRTKNN